MMPEEQINRLRTALTHARAFVAGGQGNTKLLPEIDAALEETKPMTQKTNQQIDIVEELRCASERAIAEIGRLRNRERELIKWANCGGPPTGKKCSIDGHEIYGPFWGDPNANEAICELHGMRREIERLWVIEADYLEIETSWEGENGVAWTRPSAEQHARASLAADKMADALRSALGLLDVAPMSAPYNDRSHGVRVDARAALAAYEAIK